MDAMATDFTIADVLAWARSKPADETYSYWCNRCAIGQFLMDTGRALDPLMAELWWSEGAEGNRNPIDAALNDAARTEFGEEGRTFAQLVERLEPLVPATLSNWLQIEAYLTDIEQVSA
jgi:hypothetical protein